MTDLVRLGLALVGFAGCGHRGRRALGAHRCLDQAWENVRASEGHSTQWLQQVSR
jgi:hypothetical protein